MNIEIYRKRLHSIIEQIYDNHDKEQDYNILENLAVSDFYDLAYELILALEKKEIIEKDIQLEVF